MRKTVVIAALVAAGSWHSWRMAHDWLPTSESQHVAALPTPDPDEPLPIPSRAPND